MTTIDGVAMVLTIFLALPLIYLAISYWIWKGDDEWRREQRRMRIGRDQ